MKTFGQQRVPELRNVDLLYELTTFEVQDFIILLPPFWLSFSFLSFFLPPLLFQVLAPPLQQEHYPFFTFCEKRQCEILSPEICIAESDFKRTHSVDNISDNFLVVDCLANSEPP